MRVAELDDHDEASVHELLVDLTLDEQRFYTHPQESRDDVARRLRVSPRFEGENHFLIARDGSGAALGLCWVVLYDPGNGLEAEVAELYVRPGSRGRGIAKQLAVAAMSLIRARGVSFASVWTRNDNPAALAVYRSVGFRATEQTVLTWLPL